MAEVVVRGEIEVSSDRLWALLLDFGSVGWMQGVTHVEVQGSGEGMSRIIGEGDQAIIEVLNIAPAEFFHRHRTVIFEALLCRIVASCNTPQLSLRFSAGQFRCPHSVQSKRKPSGASPLSILDYIAALARPVYPEPKTG